MNIFDDVKYVIEYSQEIENPRTDLLEEDFYEAKSKFIEMFGGLTYTYPEKVTFELSEKVKKERYKSFLSYVAENYRDRDLYSFIKHCGEKNFYENIVEEAYQNKVPKGMKVIKAFKRFNLTDKELRELQDAASMIIQENKVSGYLTISVHPLDFLSMSVNNCGWHSCMALDGEYRRGILSYMMDSSTAIVYLSSGQKEELPGFGDIKWNSKKWRMLLHFSNDMNAILFGRQYPFESTSAENLVIDKIIKNFIEVEKTDIVYHSNLYGKITDVGDHYNDVRYSSTYKNIVSINLEQGSHFHIGATVPCMRCGEYETEDQCEYNLKFTTMCDECELEYGENLDDSIRVCEVCGCKYNGNYEEEFLDGDGIAWNLCSTCMEEEVSFCDNCGYYFLKRDMHDDNICNACYEYLEEEEEEYGERFVS